MPKEKDDLKFSKLPPAFNPPFTGLLKLEIRKADLQPSIATEALEVSRAA
jgi:hypothetical protein